MRDIIYLVGLISEGKAIHIFFATSKPWNFHLVLQNCNWRHSAHSLLLYSMEICGFLLKFSDSLCGARLEVRMFKIKTCTSLSCASAVRVVLLDEKYDNIQQRIFLGNNHHIMPCQFMGSISFAENIHKCYLEPQWKKMSFQFGKGERRLGFLKKGHFNDCSILLSRPKRASKTSNPSNCQCTVIWWKEKAVD